MDVPPTDLARATPEQWEQILERARPAELIAVLELRMGQALHAQTTAEDLWQETLLHAWRDRARFVWHGPGSFRRWLLALAMNRVRDFVDHNSAQCRSPDGGPVRFAEDQGGSESESGAVPAHSSTPSRGAVRREIVAAVHAALTAVPAEDRGVVRLRLLEERTLEETAQVLGLPASAVKQRFRRGAEVYERELRARLGSGFPP